MMQLNFFVAKRKKRTLLCENHITVLIVVYSFMNELKADTSNCVIFGTEVSSYSSEKLYISILKTNLLSTPIAPQ